MNTQRTRILSLLLCIAVASLLLQFAGGITPADATRGFIHGTITAADYAPNSPPIRGITVFIARADGSSPLTLRTDVSGRYTTGVIDDRGIGFTVHVNKPDVAGYNNRYEDATAATILFSPTDRDGEIRDFGLHGSSSATLTPTATATPSATPTATPPITPTQVTPTATPTPTPTQDGGDEAGDGDEPDEPSQQTETVTFGGTVIAYTKPCEPPFPPEDKCPEGLKEIWIYGVSQDAAKSTFYAKTDKDGHWSTPVPKNNAKVYTITANMAIDVPNHPGQHDSLHPKNPDYDTKSTPGFQADRDRNFGDFTLGDGWITYGGKVELVKPGDDEPLPGIWVYSWRQDEAEPLYVPTNDKGEWSIRVQKWDRVLYPNHKYNIVANKELDGHPRNAEYTVSQEKPDVNPEIASKDNILFLLAPSRVTFSGRVHHANGGIGGIPLTFDKNGRGIEKYYASTDSNGYFRIELDGSTSDRYQVTANREIPLPGPGYQRNPAWTTYVKPEMVYSCWDQNIIIALNPVLAITSVSPTSAIRGEVITVHITGNNFASRPTLTLSKVGSATLNGQKSEDCPNCRTPTCIEATFTIPSNAAIGTWTLTLKNPDGQSATAQFMIINSWVSPPTPKPTITPGPAPYISSISPKDAPRGTVVSPLNIYGGNFMTDTFIPTVKLTRTGSAAIVGTGVQGDRQSLKASFIIPSTAAIGTWNVVVTNPYGMSATKANAFTVKEPPQTLDVRDAKAEMISPNKLGFGATVKFPASSTKRYVTVSATFPDKSVSGSKTVSETVDVTSYTRPDTYWSTNQADGHVTIATPLVIDLEVKGVNRFTSDILVPVTVTASYDSGTDTKSLPGSAAIRLPVIVYHGHCDPNGYGRCDAPGPDQYMNALGYQLFLEHLRDRGYSTTGYITLYGPGTDGPMYTHPERATSAQIRRDVHEDIETAKKNSYADKVILVGHSFGGLVSRFYASQQPDQVKKVITVGSPLEGVTNFYEILFTNIRSREEADARSKTADGSPNVLTWAVPMYHVLNLPSNAPSTINIDVDNTFNSPPVQGVEYHYIYAINLVTNQTLTLALNDNGTWYHVESATTGMGDGTVLDFSAANEHGSNLNVWRHPVTLGRMEKAGSIPIDQTKTTHSTMFMDDVVHQEILRAINQGTPFAETTTCRPPEC